MNLRIDIVSVPVSDQGKAQAFYKQKLGFDTVLEIPMNPSQKWIEMAPPGTETRISLVTNRKMAPGSLDGLILASDDIDAAHRELERNGLEISSIKSENWGRFANFADPDGNTWMVIQATM